MKTERIFALILLIATLPLNAIGKGESPQTGFKNSIAALEKKSGGRLGVAVLNLANGEHFGYRAKERFAMCSTHKLLLVAAVLARVDKGAEKLNDEVKYRKADVLSYAPITSKQVKNGSGEMSVSALCAAAIEYSDNTAANLLLKRVGGPAGLTRYLRSLGDKVTRLDRNEPTLNSNLPGDKRDTTTPDAMVHTMRKLLVGDALSDPSKKLLIGWLIHCKTGDERLRAGFNSKWKVGDKTGTGERGAANDVAIVWPPKGAPFLIAVFCSGSTISPKKRSAVIAEVGRIVGAKFSKPDKK